MTPPPTPPGPITGIMPVTGGVIIPLRYIIEVDEIRD